MIGGDSYSGGTVLARLITVSAIVGGVAPGSKGANAATPPYFTVSDDVRTDDNLVQHY